MVNETRQKIMDTALKEFAEKGYRGATTRDIAAKAGFNNSTLFRKFETKNNLFRSVLNEYNQKMMKEFFLIIADDEFKTDREFLENLVYNLLNLCRNNFEFIKITINESNKIQGKFLDKFVNHLTVYVEKNIPNKGLDYKVLVFDILSFIYFLIVDYGHVFTDHDKAVANFISNTVKISNL